MNTKRKKGNEMVKMIMGALALCMFVSMAFAEKENKVTVAAHVVGNRIVVIYNFPKGAHQSFDKELFKFDVAPVKGIEFGDVVYPAVKEKGKKEVVFHGRIELSRTFKITGKPATKNLKITASYQACLDSGMCHMPQDVEIEVTLP
jgi:thiol:disulfide interchange protein